MRDFLQFILDGDLKLGDLVLEVRILDALTHLKSLFVHVSLEQSLGVVQLVLGVELRELLVALGCGGKVLDIVVTVS